MEVIRLAMGELALLVLKRKNSRDVALEVTTTAPTLLLEETMALPATIKATVLLAITTMVLLATTSELCSISFEQSLTKAPATTTTVINQA